MLMFQFPYMRQPVTDPVKTLNALINLRRDSVKLVKFVPEIFFGKMRHLSEITKNSFIFL